MSISSEIARISSAVSTQTDLISQIKTALEGKAGGSSGSGEIPTCTVVISLDSDANLIEFGYSYLNNNNEIDVEHVSRYPTEYITNTTVKLENVICGSLMYVYVSGPSLTIELTDNINRFSDAHYSPTDLYKAPTEAGSTGTITCIGDD